MTNSVPVAMALRAGEFSLHHELTAHRSAPNNAGHRRVGIGLNYISTHVRVDSPVRLKAMLVRGEDRHGHFDLVDPPAAERDAAALAVHHAVSEQYRANYKVQVGCVGRHDWRDLIVIARSEATKQSSTREADSGSSGRRLLRPLRSSQ